MKITKFVLATILFSVLQMSCNPECELAPNVTVLPKFGSPGTDILITAEPPSALDRSLDVFFNDEKAEILFIANAGLKVKIPLNTPEQAVLRVMDSDCDFGELDFNVVPDGFFTNNPDFVFPSPPNLIIPSIPPSFPPALSNQWFSPQDPDYCIWFKMEKIDDVETINIDSTISRELSECYFASSPTPSYHCNKVSGTLDKDKNEIHFWINRSEKNLPIEEFTGQFIDMDLSGYDDPGIPCENNEGNEWEIEKTMMLIRSLKTGKQLLMHRVKNAFSPPPPNSCD